MPVVTRSKSAAANPVLDFSKMPKKPISEGFVFPKSTEQKLADAVAEIEELKKSLAEKDTEIAGLQLMLSYNEEDIGGLKEELKEALARGDRLLDRTPFSTI